MATDNSKKSFWERPEGTTGMIVLFAFLAGLGWFTVTTILPFLLALVWTGLELTIAGTTLFALLFVLSDKKNWARAWAAYQVVMRKSTGLIIELDPIAIMRGYVDDLKDKGRILLERIANIRGEIVSLKQNIDNNAQATETALHMAGAAKEAHKQNIFVLKSREAGRLQTSNRTLQQLYEKMTMVHRYLTRAKESNEFLVADLTSEIDVQSRERRIVHAAYSAISAARSAIEGDKNKRALFDEALEVQAADYGQKMGVIEEFMDVSGAFLDGLDLQNGIYEEQALKQLEEWEKKSDMLLLEDKHLVLPEQISQQPAYANLFQSKKGDSK